MKSKKEIFFHEEAHLYFEDKSQFFGFKTSFEKNKIYAMENKDNWEWIPSITQILSDLFPFQKNLEITKRWLLKEMKFKKIDEDTIVANQETLERIDNFLKASSERSQVEGNIGHDCIQKALEEIVKDKKISTKNDNVYYQAFLKELKTNEKLRKFLGEIKEVLPSEVPVIGNVGSLSYAGKWDILVKMNDDRVILIDIKTGSNVSWDKKRKVQIQLEAYKNLIKQEFDIKVDEMYCWELSYSVDKTTYDRAYYFKTHFVKDNGEYKVLFETFYTLRKLKREMSKKREEDEKENKVNSFFGGENVKFAIGKK